MLTLTNLGIFLCSIALVGAFVGGIQLGLADRPLGRGWKNVPLWTIAVPMLASVILITLGIACLIGARPCN